MLTCKTAHTEPDTTKKTSNLSIELEGEHGGFVRLNIFLYTIYLNKSASLTDTKLLALNLTT